MSPQPLQLQGVVRRQTVNANSKSERDAVTLETPEGQSYVLRRKGGPAFGDDTLNQLVGHRIEADGLGLDRTLIMQDWRIKG